jgi:1-hydroxy-2-methyl-2-(E)-butenyl 4-diphosphate synthase
MTSNDLRYCPDLLRYARRATREVMVGNVGVGGDNPIRVQSMITSDTRDTQACVAEVLGLAKVGSEIVRITAQTKIYAANLEHIAKGVRAAGCDVPLVADIHFKPDAAMEAAKWVEKVRVNPGNFVDKKKFEIREYSDVQYAEELERIREEFTPLVTRCKELGRAMRIGTNHGSLSDRIMNRYGDTPLGMCESALEFARLARENDYHAFIFSMKASNPKVMIEAYRLLVARLDAEGPDWNYPIHLGVTEAGDGEDGRIKSAIGIGSLLADGIGDTIRVSLTEDSVFEIPVAQALAEPFNARSAVDSGWGVSPQTVHGASRSMFDELAETMHPDWDACVKETSTNFPHWRVPGATYAVTFRLVDSLPPSTLDDYRQKQSMLLDRLDAAVSKAGSRNSLATVMAIRSELADLQGSLIEPALNLGYGDCFLNRREIAEIVLAALRHFDGSRYILHAWAIMPNHVHVVLTPENDEKLEKILHSWKSFTAKKANEIIGRSGGFWQEEYYDHVVRDGEDFRNQVRYVVENPSKGGASREWTGSRYGVTWGEVLGAGRSKHSLGRDAPATLVPAAPEEVLAAGRPKHGLGRDAPATLVPAALGGETLAPSYDPFSYERRASRVMTIMGHELGGGGTVRVVTTQERWNALAHKIAGMGDFKPEIIFEKSGVVEIDPRDEAAVSALNDATEPRLVTVADGLELEVIAAFRELAFKVDPRHPVLLKDTLQPPVGETDFIAALLPAARNIGSLLCDGIGDAVLVRGETAPGQSLRLAYNILQAAGTRIFKTDYVACPSCGRTLFNLQATTQKIREATGHLKGVRIAVMGCIVNGPGEMADADFGYVGGAPGKINLYVGKTAVKFNIPAEEAVERLTDLIREHGKWVDAPEPATADV